MSFNIVRSLLKGAARSGAKSGARTATKAMTKPVTATTLLKSSVKGVVLMELADYATQHNQWLAENKAMVDAAVIVMSLLPIRKTLNKAGGLLLSTSSVFKTSKAFIKGGSTPLSRASLASLSKQVSFKRNKDGSLSIFGKANVLIATFKWDKVTKSLSIDGNIKCRLGRILAGSAIAVALFNSDDEFIEGVAAVVAQILVTSVAEDEELVLAKMLRCDPIVLLRMGSSFLTAIASEFPNVDREVISSLWTTALSAISNEVNGVGVHLFKGDNKHVLVFDDASILEVTDLTVKLAAFLDDPQLWPAHLKQASKGSEMTPFKAYLLSTSDLEPASVLTGDTFLKKDDSPEMLDLVTVSHSLEASEDEVLSLRAVGKGSSETTLQVTLDVYDSTSRHLSEAPSCLSIALLRYELVSEGEEFNVGVLLLLNSELQLDPLLMMSIIQKTIWLEPLELEIVAGGYAEAESSKGARVSTSLLPTLRETGSPSSLTQNSIIQHDFSIFNDQ